MKHVPIKAGLGLRGEHHEEVLQTKPDVSWWEIHTENFFAEGGAALRLLSGIADLYPLSFHGVGLSLGTAGKLDKEHLSKTKYLIDRFKPALVSEHISWGQYNNIHTNDLLPLPYNEESLEILSRNINHTQDFFGRQILLENPSTYLEFKSSTMSEHQFIDQMVANTKCAILLDVNNVYVSSKNNDFNPFDYIKAINPKYIKEIHLAGHEKVNKNLIIDTHNDKVCKEVWHLYDFTIKTLGPIPTLIEWDADLPSLEILRSEEKKAQAILDKYNANSTIENGLKTKRPTERIY